MIKGDDKGCCVDRLARLGLSRMAQMYLTTKVAVAEKRTLLGSIFVWKAFR